VCGGNQILNEVYLDMAYHSKGTVHFNTYTVSNISGYEEGSTVSVGKTVYILKNGKFVRKG
jgi:hypothetical protein